MKTSKLLTLLFLASLWQVGAFAAYPLNPVDASNSAKGQTGEITFGNPKNFKNLTNPGQPIVAGDTFTLDIYWNDSVLGAVTHGSPLVSWDDTVINIVAAGSEIHYNPDSISSIPSTGLSSFDAYVDDRLSTAAWKTTAFIAGNSDFDDEDPSTNVAFAMQWNNPSANVFQQAFVEGFWETIGRRDRGSNLPLKIITLAFKWKQGATKSNAKINLGWFAVTPQLETLTGDTITVNGPPLPEKPSAPQNLVVTSGTGANKSTGLTLNWEAPSTEGCVPAAADCIEGYKIERAEDASFSTAVETVQDFSDNITTTTYSDTGLTAGTTYHYRVSAQNKNPDATMKTGDPTAVVTYISGTPIISTNVTGLITALAITPPDQISPITISIDGGDATSFAIQPTLPAGLGINATNGTISGAATATKAETVYTITATGAGNATGITTIRLRAISAGLNLAGRTKIDTTTNGYGGPFTFTVALLSNPPSEVKVGLVVTGPGTTTMSMAASLSTNELTFGSSNWETPQTITIVGAQSVTNQQYEIRLTPSSTAPNPYQSSLFKTIIGENVAPPKLSATPGEYTATVGTEIASEMIITETGGDVEMYKWSPKGGPTGITINAGNGGLNGTPLTAIDKMSYDIVATNIAGTATISISFSAVSAPTGTVDSNSVGYSIMQTGTSATLKITASAPISGAKVGPYTDNGTMFLKDQLLAHARETGNVKGPGTDPNSRINIDDERYLLRVNVDSKSCASGCDLEFMISEADLPDGVSSSDELVIFTYDFVGGIWTALATNAIPTTGTGPVSYTVTASTNRLSGAVALGNIRSINQLTVAAASRLVRSIMPKVTQALLASTVVSIEDRISANLRGKPLAQLLKFNGTTINIGSSDLGFMDTIKKKIGSKSTWKQLEKTANGEAINFEFDWKKALTKSSFSLPINSLRRKRSKGQDASAGGAIWGRGDYRNLRSKEDVNWKADLVSFQLGADAKFYDNLLLGGMVSWHESDGDYSLNEGGVQKGDFNHKMISLHPYAAWSDKGVTIWGSFGYGQGELEALDQSNTKHSSDTEMFALSTGIKGKLLPMLNVKADVALAWTEIDKSNTYDGTVGIKEETVNTQRYRFILEAKNDYKTKFGNFTPSAEVGARYDTGDGDNGVGAELGGGLKYFNPKMGLSVEGRGRTLVGQSGYREWGIGGAIRLSQSKGGRGLSFKLEPTYGDRKSDKNSVFNSVNTKQGENKASDNYSAGMKTELSYGLLGFNDQGLIKPYGSMNLSNKVQTYKMGIDITGLEGNGSLKPYGTMSLNENNNSKYTMGIDWNPGSVFTMKLFGERNYKAKDNKTDNAMKIEGKLRF